MTIRWYGLVAPEEAATGDRRMFAGNGLTNRDFPLPAAWQRVSGSGHQGSVVVASWDRRYQGDGGVWGAGEFLDPGIVPEVTEAIYLLEKRLIGPSVDLDPDFAYEVVPHPDRPDEFAMKVTRGNVHGVTFVMGPAFPQVHITVDTEEEMSILASAGITSATFATSGVNSASWRKFPLAPRETAFDADTAIDRIAAWSGGDAGKFSSAFLWKDPQGNPLNRETYRLPVVDILDGKAYLIPRAVFSAGVIMSGGHGGLYDTLDQAERLKVQEVITDMYDMLRQEYSDPRVTAPWQKGGREGARNEEDTPTRVASLENDMINEELDFYIQSRIEAEFAVRSSGWSSMPISTAAWDEGAARRALDAWAGDDMGKYGRAFLWSDGSGNRTGFKFPIAKPVDGTLTVFIRAVNNAKARLNQADIPAADKARIESVLNAIQRRHGGGRDNEAGFAMDGMDHEDDKCPEGKHMMPDGTCMDDEDMPAEEYQMIIDLATASPEFQSRLGGELEEYWVRGEGAAKIRWGTEGSFDRCVRALRDKFPKDTEGLCANLHHEATGKWPAEGKKRGEHALEDDAVVAAGVLKPDKSWFVPPVFTGPQPLQVTDDGRVFGHLATWKQCHMGVGNRCVIAPHSRTNYQFFKQGSVLTSDGSTVRVGKITLGTGHADKSFGVVPAVEHYDHTGTCVAVVNAGEDSFGVWVAGALVDGTTDAQAAELRRSPLSGDWRRVDGNLELVAALAVNSPGFPVLHEDGDGSYSLTAAGVLEPDGSVTQPEAAGGMVEPAAVTDRFAAVDSFLAQAVTADRRERVNRAFHDLLPSADCGCNG